MHQLLHDTAPPLPHRLRRTVLSTPLGAFAETHAIVALVLRYRFPDRDCIRALSGMARNDFQTPWEVRSLATLALQFCLWKIPRAQLDDHDDALVQLGLKSKRGRRTKLKRFLLKDGFNSLDLAGFVSEWKHYLDRHRDLFRQFRGDATPPDAIANFLLLSMEECKLALARYLFDPREVVERIRCQTQVSKGFDAPFTESRPTIESVAKKTRALLPNYEASILDLLCEGTDILWVSPDTSSRLNSLAEYPVGTIVLVVKPPGSWLEFEIKRVGLKKSNRLLGIVYSRNRKPVHHTHRLDGGSVIWNLQYEAAASSRIAAIYGLVHDQPAPICMSHKLNSIYTIPTQGGERVLLDYFTEAKSFGKDYRKMRKAMGRSVKAYFDGGQRGVRELPGHLGASHNFLIQYWPAQAVQSGTTSFRVEVLEELVCGMAVQRYFGEVLDGKPTARDHARLADQILQELLGHYASSPSTSTGNARQRIRNGLAHNRSRADRIYRSLLLQIGKFWGTILAIRAYSNGESTTMRNTGVKCVWESGRWNVRFLFMDHDDLHIPPHHLAKRPTLGPLMRGMRSDRRHVINSSRYLARIYRVSMNVRKSAEAALLKAASSAYRATLRSVASDRQLRRLFKPAILDWLLEIDRLVRTHKKAMATAAGVEGWETRTRQRLSGLGWGDGLIDDHIETVLKQHEFLVPTFDD